MKGKLKLFMVMLGCTPKGRLTEQHDIFFGVGETLRELVPQMIAYWPEADGKMHIDAWREVTSVDGYTIEIASQTANNPDQNNLFFLNLGGYKENEFEEYHYKILAVAATMAEAVKRSKHTAFYKHSGFKGAASHIDDKYGIDVDDSYKVADIFPDEVKEKYQLQISKSTDPIEDELHIGYFMLNKI